MSGVSYGSQQNYPEPSGSGQRGYPQFGTQLTSMPSYEQGGSGVSGVSYGSQQYYPAPSGSDQRGYPQFGTQPTSMPSYAPGDSGAGSSNVGPSAPMSQENALPRIGKPAPPGWVHFGYVIGEQVYPGYYLTEDDTIRYNKTGRPLVAVVGATDKAEGNLGYYPAGVGTSPWYTFPNGRRTEWTQEQMNLPSGFLGQVRSGSALHTRDETTPS